MTLLNKTILIISGGIEAVEGILEANRMGLRTIVVDGDKDCPGRKIASHFFHIDTYDEKGLLRKCLEYLSQGGEIDGVISIAADVPYTVSSIGNALDLPAISLKAAMLASDKYLMKTYLKKMGVPVPYFKKITSLSDLLSAYKEIGPPFVLKPVDSRGARGALLINDKDMLEWAFRYSIGFSRCSTLIGEEFIKGRQLSTESIVLNGKFYHIGFSDRNYTQFKKFLPHIIENGGELPSSISIEERRAVERIIEKGANALSFSHGTVKGDIVMSHNGPMIIELAPRLSGGYFATHEIPLSTGVPFVRCAIKAAVNEKLSENELKIRHERFIVQRYFFPEEGFLRSIDGIREAMQHKWLKLFKIYYKDGDKVPKISSHVKRGGVFIVEGRSREEAVKRADTIYNTVKWHVDKTKATT